MNGNSKDSTSYYNHHHTMRCPSSSPSPSPSSSTSIKSITKLAFSLLLLISLFYILYTITSIYAPSSPSSSYLSSSSSSSCIMNSSFSIRTSVPGPEPEPEPTGLSHVVFGIGAASRHWNARKEYIKFWWRPKVTRGFVFLDKQVEISGHERSKYPELKISTDTSRFNYTNRKGSRSAIRITRIISEMVRMNLPNIRWFVLGDDDTVFFPDNLIQVLSKYDHTRMHYIGSSSETHLQNIYFSYNMAYGGGGFAISYPLAIEIEKIQDRCIEQYSGLYGSDDRVQACVAELGVPLTKEPGFHQFDVIGSAFGLLTAHPVAPMVTLHHLDILEPIFPFLTRIQALTRLRLPAKIDPGSLFQQSICYDPLRNWTVSVSWGYAVQVISGSIPVREMELPARTFLTWYKKDDPAGFAFNTRPVAQHPCQKPFIFFMSNVVMNWRRNESGSEYMRHRIPRAWCWWKWEDPNLINRVEVYKKLDSHLWSKAPRRNCCRVMPAKKKATMVIDVGECRQGEVMKMP